MLNVLLTIDTEVYPLRSTWRAENLGQDIDRDIYGKTAQGPFGLSYQIEVLNNHGLKAAFFVEGLFADAVGIGPLTQIVEKIQSGGHQVQLHLHPEWLAWTPQPVVPSANRETLDQFSYDEQAALVMRGMQNLRTAGVEKVRAFRSGDFAANADTLRVLYDQGIEFDTSYNQCYPHSLGNLSELRGALQPKRVLGVWEFPISWRRTVFGRRHAQICSCSTGELKAALLAAWRRGWHSFVIVSHSFELLRKRRQRVNHPAPDWVVVRRFQRLCHFLRDNADKFRTCGFGDITMESAAFVPARQLAYSAPHHTLWRVLQQGYRRIT